MKLISFCMYGDASMYLKGAVENAKLMKEIYPDWKMVVFHDVRVKVDALKKYDVLLAPSGRSLEHSGMLWRFLPAWWNDVERVIFRDTDSRLNIREAAAVKEWEESGLDAHCMHDHRHHASLPIFGGMWGIKGGVLSDAVKERTEKLIGRRVKRVGDMLFLKRFVLPEIEGSLLRHSSVPTEWKQQPFPEHEEQIGFVGQQHAKGGPLWP